MIIYIYIYIYIYIESDKITICLIFEISFCVPKMEYKIIALLSKTT